MALSSQHFIIDALTANQAIRQLGDSGIYIKVSSTLLRGDAGIEMFKTGIDRFISLAQEALPNMSNDYAAFYRHCINDYEKNGISMPFWENL